MEASFLVDERDSWGNNRNMLEVGYQERGEESTYLFEAFLGGLGPQISQGKGSTGIATAKLSNAIFTIYRDELTHITVPIACLFLSW